MQSTPLPPHPKHDPKLSGQGSLDGGVGDCVPPPPSAESFGTAMQQSGQQRQRPKLSKLSSFECASLSSGKSEVLCNQS